MENWDISAFNEIISEMFERMEKIGKTKEGGFSRLVYTDEWYEGISEIKAMMEATGLETKFDNVGNLFGRLAASNSTETIVSGSHSDTVTNGGLYDGLYGILAALTAIKYLKNTFGKPKKNLEVLAVCEEEGSRFPTSYWGASNIIKNVTYEESKELIDLKGLHISDEMRKYGFDYKSEASKIRDDISKFIEVHIEQGGILEQRGKQIGIVDSIVGLRCLSVEVTGEANHAGTTPMNLRKDAMNSASHMITKLLDKAEEYGEPLVFTVGSISVLPNVSNVIPANVSFSIDARHPDELVLNSLVKDIEEIVSSENEKYSTKAKINVRAEETPVPMNEELKKMFEDICKEDNTSYMFINSGAGHDSQLMAEKFTTAMLFVPSINGISHSPKELTNRDDLTKGAYILAKLLYKLAY